ncbi:sulfonate transport system substrate-binding protein [Paenibacillus cellulosilyticus]|uniref:Sulfonate transport system substrate-binding protein n=1 Tax=Paenibacillus cellulosilyticus TaxID=375489 RepID=A0A2V2YTA8_9BACL|nr:ABC transporter substrate-binding protein [Paenibacillus cellulosilyticus]PWV99479.1 sulfonate transport system substrate-binding protein [Paenibacillus cellulosilyticus]
MQLGLALLSIALLLSGCGEQDAEVDKLVRQPIDNGKLKLGYSGSSALIGLQDRGDLEAKLAKQSSSVAVEWQQFDDDASLFRAIEEGRVDIGAIGDAVPALLRREDASLVYLAAEPANPAAYAIVVPLDSDIYTMADLKGKKVAYAPSSNEHLLLLQALDAANLSQHDIKAVELAPADTLHAMEQREADAWAISEPELSHVEPLGIRIIADSSQSVAQRDIYVTTPESLQGREALFKLAIDSISEYDDWIGAQVHDAAELFAGLTSIEHAGWLGSFDRKAYGTAPFLTSIVQEEQRIADTAQELGERKSRVDVQLFIRDWMTE